MGIVDELLEGRGDSCGGGEDGSDVADSRRGCSREIDLDEGMEEIIAVLPPFGAEALATV